MMYRIKGCPRCQVGDVFSASDEYGAYEQCFQCGWVNYGDKVLSQKAAEEEKLQAVGAKERRGRR